MHNRIEIAREFARTINSENIVRIILFGSVARGDDSEESDIDILIVSPIAKEIRKDINKEVVEIILDKEEFISAHMMTEEYFNKTKNFPFLSNVLKDGIILG